MANEQLLRILKQGAKAWNRWRDDHREIKAEFSGGSLRGADLCEADLSNANLEEADLSEADLRVADLRAANLGKTCFRGANVNGANLVEANLGEANLRDAFLVGANLFNANLGGADLRGATLFEANLVQARLKGADLSSSKFGYTSLGAVDLSPVKGLETVEHSGPSTIGIDTIYLSNGKVPEGFLRGAGVPGSLITYMKSLVSNPIEFYSCFISYSTKDQEFAERLHSDLQNKNVRCWFAPHDVHAGRKLHDQIDEAIRVHEKVLLILSAESMKSEWVKTEIAKARKREVREKKSVLFPVSLVSFEAIRDWECFDADTGKDSAREVREYFIPDFSEWKEHDSYQRAFEMLIRDLKAVDSNPTNVL